MSLGTEDAGLVGALLDALRPRGAGERVRQVVSRGWTASQVYDRLPEDVRARMTGPRPIDEVHRTLVDLARDGRVRVRRARWAMPLNTKGMRDMVVDLFRL